MSASSSTIDKSIVENRPLPFHLWYTRSFVKVLAKPLLATKTRKSKSTPLIEFGKLMLQNKMVLAILVAVVGALGGGIFTFAIGLPTSPCTGVIGVTRSFTIIAGPNGFNDSSKHAGSWPEISVNRCDLVNITVINSDLQTHGFAIEYYGVKGAELIGQQTYNFPIFQATRAGQFRVYCNVPCSVHILMQSGLLIVS